MLKAGTLPKNISYSLETQIQIADFKLFAPTQDFFVSPPYGCYVSDLDTKKKYVQGFSELESDKALGIVKEKMKESSSKTARFFVFTSVLLLAFVVFWFRRSCKKV